MKQLPKIVRMCETSYRTASPGGDGRVRAKHLTTGRIAWVNWDHELGKEENHIQAAIKVLGRCPEFCTSIDGGGYIFGVDPANDPQGP